MLISLYLKYKHMYRYKYIFWTYVRELNLMFTPHTHTHTHTHTHIYIYIYIYILMFHIYNQYTNFCYNITKMFFLYIILLVCLYLYIDWLIFWACSIIVVKWYNLNSWVWSYILISFATPVYKYTISTYMMKWMMMIRMVVIRTLKWE